MATLTKPKPEAPSVEQHLKVSQNGKLDGGFLNEFYRDIDTAGITRLQLLMDRLLGTSVEERDRSLKEFKASNRVQGPKGKEVIDPVASTRASEIKSLWAGLNIVGMTPKEWLEFGGYHKIVQAARMELNERKINTEGEQIKKPEEKREAKQLEAMAVAEAQARLQNPRKEGEDKMQYLMRIMDTLDSAAEKSVAELDQDRATSIFNRLIEKESAGVIAHLVDMLRQYKEHVPQTSAANKDDPDIAQAA